ncbi:MAG TPA: hypothetical protein PLP34_00770 [Chitinophagaceae bacterium]|nr:hypothetical protein [Chitinophagaceae bacterium]HNF70913.1 hypothetical protein [Chitinophagaceae bacterium]
MKNLKNIALASLLTLGAFSLTLFTSCDPDPCEDIVCANGGTCTDGTCACPAGYEGTLCETLSRTKFLGVFTGNETCTLGTDTYSITCTANSDDTKFNIQNLYNQSSVTAIASANGNAFTIPSQTVMAGTVAVGSGTISGNTITVTYTISDGTNTNTCTFTGTK